MPVRLTRLFATAALAGGLAIGGVACSDDDDPNTDDIENEMDDVGDDIEDGVDDVGDDIEDGVDDVEEDVED